MTTITLNVPDDLAKKLEAFDESTLTALLAQAVADYEPAPAGKAEFKRLPTAALPEPKFDISRAEWKKRLLSISAWSDNDIQAIEEAIEYINQWQPRKLF